VQYLESGDIDFGICHKRHKSDSGSGWEKDREVSGRNREMEMRFR
jgi:hypothetical protein